MQLGDRPLAAGAKGGLVFCQELDEDEFTADWAATAAVVRWREDGP